jgi:hypothetical protein
MTKTLDRIGWIAGLVCGIVALVEAKNLYDAHIVSQEDQRIAEDQMEKRVEALEWVAFPDEMAAKYHVRPGERGVTSQP